MVEADLMCVSISRQGLSKPVGELLYIPFGTELATGFAGEKFIADAIDRRETAVTACWTGKFPDLFVLAGNLWND